MHYLMPMSLLAGAALVSPVALAAPTAAPPQPLSDAQLRTLVDGVVAPMMSRYDIPGMAVALSVAGRAYVFNYGLASTQPPAPVTDTTRFEIGSVSKVLTATLAAYAQASGKLSMSDHPSRHLPALKGAALERATLLHLGSYTAGGLPLQFPDAVQTDADALAYYRTFKPAASPGVVRRYSNPSLGLFGLVTARALGQDFASALETRLFPAFGMTHSHVHMPEVAMPDYAWGHRDGEQVRMQPGPLAEPTYGVKTTAADLLRFVQANLDPQGLAPTLRRAVTATQAGHFRAGPLVQGLGWEHYPYPVSREWLLGGNSPEMILQPQPATPLRGGHEPAAQWFNKTGSTGGFGAYVAFVPAQRLGLVMLANRNFPIPARIDAAWTLLDALDHADE